MGEVDGASVKHNVVFACLVVVMLCTVVLGLCFVVQITVARDRFEKEAVQAGAARWVFDEAGDPHFEWRKP